MNPQGPKNPVYEDEIDLYEIWKNITKRKKLILGIFFISIVSAALISLLMPKVYRGETVLRMQIKELISAKELIDILGNMDRERIQQIFPEDSNFIMSLKMIQVPGSTDKFKIAIELSEVEHFQDAMNRTIEYLKNIPLVKRKVEETREQLAKRMEKIDVIMEKSQRDAESFQKMMIREKLNPIGFNPVQFNRMVSDLEIEKIILKQEMQNLNGYDIITQPIIFRKPVSPKPKIYILIGGVAGLVGGVLAAAFLNFFENIKKGSH